MNSLIAVTLLCCSSQAQQLETAEQSCQTAIDRGSNFLYRQQADNGGFSLNTDPTLHDVWANSEANRSWHIATTSIAAMAWMAQPREATRDSRIGRVIDYLCNSPLAKRPDDWDTDNTWAYVYSLCALTRAANHEYIKSTKRSAAVKRRAKLVMQELYIYQSPMGGWAYYAEETKAVTPNWATSFQTAVAVIGLLEAKGLGWAVDEHRLQVAIDTLIHCRLPDGSYTYSVEIIPRLDVGTGIDNVKGGLSRIQSCNYALFLAKQMGYETPIGEKQIKVGLQQFFAQHHYLDIARGRPLPHEAFHYNSGYFYFFGHYYAGLLLDMLPIEDAKSFFPAYVDSIVKTQHGDGSMLDFFFSASGKVYGAAFGVAGLCHARDSIKR